jgi:hypothetical protein
VAHGKGLAYSPTRRAQPLPSTCVCPAQGNHGQLCSVSRRWLPLPLLALTAIKQSFGASTGPGRSGSYTRYSWRYADSGVRPGGLAALATASLPSELAVRFLGRQRRARGEASTNRTHCP